MRYLKFNTLDGAEERSAQLWEETLGRDKRDEDVSSALYPFVVAEISNGGSYLLIPDKGTLLTESETDALEDEDTYQQWRQIYQPDEYMAELAEENS